MTLFRKKHSRKHNKSVCNKRKTIKKKHIRINKKVKKSKRKHVNVNKKRKTKNNAFRNKKGGVSLKEKIDFELLSENPNLTLEWIETFPNKEWDFYNLSVNPKLTLDIIKMFPSDEWYWDTSPGLSHHPNLTLEWLQTFPDEDWIWGMDGISSNPNLTLEWLQMFPDEDWDWGKYGISSNPNLSLEWLKAFPDKDLDWNEISRYAKLSLDDIKKFITKPDITKMTLEEFNKCEKDNEGNVIDPITFDNLTIDNAVMPPSASGNKSCFDRESIERWLNSNNTHPITREPISNAWKDKYL